MIDIVVCVCHNILTGIYVFLHHFAIEQPDNIHGHPYPVFDLKLDEL